MPIKTQKNGPFLAVDAVGVLTEEDLPGLFKAFEEAHRAGPFVVLTDTTNMTKAPRQVISAFADGLKSIAPKSKAWLGDAVVVKSAAVRFVVSTLIVLAPMPTEVKVFEGVPEARRWCAEILRREGLIIPPGLLKTA